MRTLTINLAGEGKSVEMPAPCYVLQAWYNGKWNNIEAHPYTKEGFERAESGYDRYPYKDMQVVSFT